MDKGPWRVGEFRNDGGVIIPAVFSADFEHDVMLRVDGDFREGERRKYCEWLVEKLNQQPHQIAGEQK